MFGGYNFGPETALGAGVTSAEMGHWDRLGWRCGQFWKIHRLIKPN
jgi:hypothetical protein